VTTIDARTESAPSALRSWSFWAPLKEAAGVAWLPWLLSKVIVGAALGLARYERSHLGVHSAKALLSLHNGLLAWDASWYQGIAAHGYGSVGHLGLRFFPLYPLLATGAHAAVGLPVSFTLVVIANMASFVAVMGIYLLTRRELDEVSARRAAWLLCLLPASFVLTMGYAEALFVVAILGAMYGARTQRWWLAGVAGLVAGATRPTGIVIAVFVLVELLRSWRESSTSQRLVGTASVLAPLLGALAYLAWTADAYGSFFLPYRIQTSAKLHGGLGDPFVVVFDAARDVLHGHVGTALHVPWIVLSLVVLVVCFARLPVSYGLFAAVVLLAALSGHNLDSFERYALTAVPLVMAAGSLLRSERVAQSVLLLSAVAMFAYALLAFLGAYTP
jgi:hypothetical protein